MKALKFVTTKRPTPPNLARDGIEGPTIIDHKLIAPRWPEPLTISASPAAVYVKGQAGPLDLDGVNQLCIALRAAAHDHQRLRSGDTGL